MRFRGNESARTLVNRSRHVGFSEISGRLISTPLVILSTLLNLPLLLKSKMAAIAINQIAGYKGEFS